MIPRFLILFICFLILGAFWSRLFLPNGLLDAVISFSLMAFAATVIVFICKTR